MLLEALAGISLSLFSFLFTSSKSNVRHGRSRPQTLQMLPQALAGIRQGRSRRQTLQMLLQALAGISLSLFSFLFTGSESNVRQGRSRRQTTNASAGPRRYLSFSFLFSLYRFKKQR